MAYSQIAATPKQTMFNNGKEPPISQGTKPDVKPEINFENNVLMQKQQAGKPMDQQKAAAQQPAGPEIVLEQE